MYPEFNPMNPTEVINAMTEQGGVVSLNNDASEDKALAVRFLLEPIKNEEESRKEGRLICDEVEYCEIRLPGTKDVIRNVVGDREKQRFAKQYAAFKSNKDQDSAAGTPLSQWPLITTSPGMIEEARYLGVRTVEGLAQVPDSGIQTLGPGWSAMRLKARDWLAKAKDGALEAKLRSENDDLRARMATLEEMLAKQTAVIQGMAPAPTTDLAGLIREQVAAALAAQPKAVEPKIRRKEG